jgi:glycosyltransferase involved in cell wall biosynthesis
VHILHLLGLSPMFLDVIRRMRIAIAVSMQDFFYACPLILLRKRSGEPCDGPDAGRECVRTCFSHEPASMALRWNHRSTYFRHLLGYANRVICPSRYIFNFFEKLGLDASRVRLIDNAVTIDSIHPLDIQQSHPAQRGCLKLAFLGTISPHKGAHVILNALRHARLGPVELRLIGARGQVPYATRLREEAKDIPDLRMRFYGAYEPRDLPVLLDDVDLAITPSIWPETFAIVVREALVRGVPIAVSRRGGLPEAVKEGENGFTFDPDHPSELTGILRRILSEPELLPRLRRGACASRVMKIAEHADAVRTVYQEAIDDLFAGGTVSLGDVQQVSFLHNVLLGSGFGAEGVKGKVAHG